MFRNSLAICSIESHVDVNGTRHKVDDVSFVDDVTVLIVDDAHGIIDKVSAVTTIAVNTFAGFGMDLNFLRENLNVSSSLWARERARLSSVCTKMVMPSILLSIALKRST